MERKKLGIGDIMLSYIDSGKGDETIILLHGFCGSSDYWSKIIPQLIDTYRVIAVDLRGHGKSSEPEKCFSIEDMADDIFHLVTALNINKAYLFGHSLGGYISLVFAKKYEDKLKGFSLVHSTAFSDSEEAKLGREVGISKINTEGLEAFVQGLIPKLFAVENIERRKADIDKVIDIGKQTSKNGAIGALSAMKKRAERNDVLQSTNVPVLLIAGKGDQVIGLEKVFSVNRESIKQVVIENAGHMSMYENYNQLVKEIKAWIR